MLKETKKKIMVQVWDELAKVVKKELRSLHISRDSYLNELLKLEIERLSSEVSYATPDEAKKHIKKRLCGIKNREKMTLALDIEVADRINQVLAEKNIHRDSFINRVLFLLVAKPEHLKRIGIEYQLNQSTAVKPLQDAYGFLNDPFFNIRENNDELFYEIPFPDEPLAKNWPNLFGLNCAISPENWSIINTPLMSLDDVFALREEIK